MITILIKTEKKQNGNNGKQDIKDDIHSELIIQYKELLKIT